MLTSLLTMQFVFLLLAIAVGSSLAHNHLREEGAHLDALQRCGTKDLTAEELVRFDALDKQKYEAAVAKHGNIDPLSAGGLPIEVYFHVIYSTTGEGQLTADEVTDSMDVLNAAFGFAPTEVFRLLPENINYVENDAWFNIPSSGSPQNAMKAALRQGGADALNIYSTKIKGGILGYATFPQWYDGNPQDDGVVLLYNSVPGGSAAPYNLGDTLVHEVGHWVGLYHTFQGGCSEIGGGDRVSDTPPESGPTFGCPANVDTCPSAGVDSLDNYMSYTDDACMDSWTRGQKRRMKQQMLAYRFNQ